MGEANAESKCRNYLYKGGVESPRFSVGPSSEKCLPDALALSVLPDPDIYGIGPERKEARGVIGLHCVLISVCHRQG